MSYKADAPTLALKPAKVDLLSLKTQMTIGLIVCLCLCLACYWHCLSMGFLLDDFLHLEYVAKTRFGEWHDFLSNLYSNWAGSDIALSYRPLTSLSFLVDYWLWGMNAFGFHLTNVLLFFCCALFVGLITLELTGLYGNRLGASAAIWAALLFSLYPLHPEAVCWVVGRVDLLCGLFYFASIFAYLRFRLLREKSYLVVSLVSFLAALLSKEMAVTIPVVITLIELCFYSNGPQRAKTGKAQQPGIQGLKYISLFWIVLVLATIFRLIFLGTIVGGYGDFSLSLVKGYLCNFFDKASLLKILYPLNEEVSLVHPVSDWIKPALTSVYVAVVMLLLVRLLLRFFALRLYAFLFCWVFICITPAFQIWHIYPNLVGSRLFFIASAPFCILLALACLPAVDYVNKRFLRVSVSLAIILLSVICTCWWLMLEANIKPWIAASKQMQVLHNQVLSILANLPSDKKVLFFDLPQDYSGAGMLTRSQYLQILCRPPFATQDLSDRFLTIEPPISGSHKYMWPRQFITMLEDPHLARIYRWSSAASQFVVWTKPVYETDVAAYCFTARANNYQEFTLIPKETPVALSNQWKVSSPQDGCLTVFPNFLRIYPGKYPLTVLFPLAALNPLQCNVADLSMQISSSNSNAKQNVDKIRLVWDTCIKSTNMGRVIKAPWCNPCETTLHSAGNGHYLAWLGRHKSWTLAKAIHHLGIKFFPGQYYVDLEQIKVLPDQYFVPALEITRSCPVIFQYNSSLIANSKKAKIIVTRSNSTFDANFESEIAAVYPSSAKVFLETELLSNKGQIRLPDNLYNSSGLHQVRVAMLDKNNAIVGLPSEPLTILVTGTNYQTNASNSNNASISNIRSKIK